MRLAFPEFVPVSLVKRATDYARKVLKLDKPLVYDAKIRAKQKWLVFVQDSKGKKVGLLMDTRLNQVKKVTVSAMVKEAASSKSSYSVPWLKEIETDWRNLTDQAKWIHDHTKTANWLEKIVLWIEDFRNHILNDEKSWFGPKCKNLENKTRVEKSLVELLVHTKGKAGTFRKLVEKCTPGTPEFKAEEGKTFKAFEDEYWKHSHKNIKKLMAEGELEEGAGAESALNRMGKILIKAVVEDSQDRMKNLMRLLFEAAGAPKKHKREGTAAPGHWIIKLNQNKSIWVWKLINPQGGGQSGKWSGPMWKALQEALKSAPHKCDKFELLINDKSHGTHKYEGHDVEDILKVLG